MELDGVWMEVSTAALSGKSGRNLMKVAERVASELENPDFSILYTTAPVNDEIVGEIKSILRCPFIGCYTEGIIHSGKLVNGAGAMAISGVKAITEISNSPKAIGEKLNILNRGSVITFMSWLTRNISTVLRSLYNYLSYNFSYAGGCAGNFYEKRSFQFTEKGVGDKICSAGIDLKMSVSFDHGWEVMKGPFIMSKYSGNRIYELDGKKAIDVYCKVTGCCKDDFDECRKLHPFGFLCACGKYKLRSPICYSDDGSIEVLSDLPYSSVTYVMECEEEDVLNAAENAVRDAITSYGSNARFAVVFDCLSRKQLLRKKFREELKRIDEIINVPYIGMLSIGEIVSTQRNCIPSFHNKTVVVAVGGV